MPLANIWTEEKSPPHLVLSCKELFACHHSQAGNNMTNVAGPQICKGDVLWVVLEVQGTPILSAQPSAANVNPE